MANKYKYVIERDNVYGDFLIGKIYWKVEHVDGGVIANTQYNSRVKSGFCHTEKGAMRHIKRAIRKYEKRLPKHFKHEGEL